jgi:hypothetical protein
MADACCCWHASISATHPNLACSSHHLRGTLSSDDGMASSFENELACLHEPRLNTPIGSSYKG